jgi:NAD(P)-dependent dehydrogenase (short-subunit alcohol dehydrogenase family)
MEIELSNFNNSVILITGAAGNLGQAVTRAFQSGGARLVLADRSADRLGHIYPDLANASNVLMATPYDLYDPESVKALVARVVNRFGRLDVLTNTVGGYRAGTPIHQTPLEVFDQMMSVNVRTAFMITQAVIPVMLVQGSGKIIHIAAKAGLVGAPNGSAYSAAKSALIRMSEAVSAEVKERGINVNVVIPGVIDTPQNRATMPNADFSKWVAPEAVADVILFLASNAARAICGATIPVTGRG